MFFLLVFMDLYFGRFTQKKSGTGFSCLELRCIICYAMHILCDLCTMKRKRLLCEEMVMVVKEEFTKKDRKKSSK